MFHKSLDAHLNPISLLDDDHQGTMDAMQLLNHARLEVVFKKAEVAGS